ncbi:hypothetical protein [Pasteurella canis]|uniref:hypothetical protein n=1 Tax=Pasteurella canis TaxID=753 RepID=UPI001321B787|nr:hypothetical protein [Pasteurella canis]MXN87593.1 hypothetical protein [Pasteurella canis]
MSTLFSFFYLYDPWLFHFLRMAFVVGGIGVAWLIYRLYTKQLTQGIAVPIDSILIIIALILLSIIPILINGTTELGVVRMYVKSLVLFVFGIGIYNLFYCHLAGQVQFVSDLKIGLVIQAAIGLFALFSLTTVIDLVLSTHTIMPRFYNSEQEYRLYNLTSSAFFQLSIFYLMLLHFLLAYDVKKNRISAFFLFLLLFIGTISGRTFFMLSIISIILYFKWRYLPALITFAAIVLFLSLNFSEHKYVAHAFEPVINLFSHQDMSKISSSSENLIKNHLFIPTLKQFLIGDGEYFTDEGKYYGATDSGFLRQVLYGGLAYLMTCFAFTAYFVKRVADNWFEGSWKFTLSTLFILSVLQIKADTYAFPGIMLIFIMFLSLFGKKGKWVWLFKNKEGMNV